MDMNGSSDTRQDSASQEQQQQHGEQSDGHHSGEGAASALAQMKQNRKDRHQQAEADDAAGSHPQ
jgi:hypothetical protein